MSGFVTPLPYMPAWRAMGRLCLYVMTGLLEFVFWQERWYVCFRTYCLNLQELGVR